MSGHRARYSRLTSSWQDLQGLMMCPFDLKLKSVRGLTSPHRLQRFMSDPTKTFTFGVEQVELSPVLRRREIDQRQRHE